MVRTGAGMGRRLIMNMLLLLLLLLLVLIVMRLGQEVESRFE